MSEDTLSLYFDCASKSDADEIHTEIEDLLLAKDEELWTSQLRFKDKQAIITLGVDLESELAEELLRYLTKKELSNVYAELYFDTAGETQFLAIRNNSLKEFKRRPPRKKIKAPTKKKTAAAKVSVAYPHMLDPAWQKARRNNWEQIVWREFSDSPKYEWKHIEKYYFTGDVKSLIEGEIKLGNKWKLSKGKIHPLFSEIFNYSPAATLDQFLAEIEHMHDWFITHESSIDDDRWVYIKSDIVSQIPILISRPEIGFDDLLANEIFFHFMGDSYDPKKSITIGKGEYAWEISFTGFEEILWQLMRSFGCYLYNSPEEDLKYASILDTRYLDYLVEMFSFVDGDMYVTRKPSGLNAKQFVTRRFLLGISEVNVRKCSKTESFYCRDNKLHECLRDRIISLPSRPSGLDKLLKFLEKHGENGYKKN
ncbi:hypothetical protein ACMXYN_06865 [Neptuniibacter sp. PT8_73]|uniref:hypothetical protein n=1 Tax=Neptuniibacter sp. PT8_73 TaxID=3398206 RepID=UPI0039F49E48